MDGDHRRALHDAFARNAILADGTIRGLDLAAGQELLIRNCPSDIPLEVLANTFLPEENIAGAREDHERNLGEHEQYLVGVGDGETVTLCHQDERSAEYRCKDIDQDRCSEEFPERGRSRFGGYEKEGGETKEERDDE